MTKFDMPIYRELGKLLKSAREEKEMSLDSLCDALDGFKTKSTLKRYEDGVSRIDMETLSRICFILGKDQNALIEKASSIVKLGRENSQWGNHEKNLQYFKDKPELEAIYNEMVKRDDIYILFDKTKDLEPKDVESVLMFVQTIRKQRGFDD